MMTLKKSPLLWRLWCIAVLFLPPVSIFADSVPQFVGLHCSQVESNPCSQVESNRFVIHYVDSPKRRGEVLLQIPSAGSPIGIKKMVYLEVSDGQIVPDVLGKTTTEAQKELKSIGIESSVYFRKSRPELVSYVLHQFPKGGTRIDPYAKIVFLDAISQKAVKVPRLETENFETWSKQLRKYGLTGRLEEKSEPPPISCYTTDSTDSFGTPNYRGFKMLDPTIEAGPETTIEAWPETIYTYNTVSPPPGELVPSGSEITFTVNKYIIWSCAPRA